MDAPGRGRRRPGKPRQDVEAWRAIPPDTKYPTPPGILGLNFLKFSLVFALIFLIPHFFKYLTIHQK